MVFTIPFAPEPGPFHDVLFWLNVICLAAMAISAFASVNVGVGWWLAIRNGEVEAAPAAVPENRATRRKKG